MQSIRRFLLLFRERRTSSSTFQEQEHKQTHQNEETKPHGEVSE